MNKIWRMLMLVGMAGYLLQGCGGVLTRPGGTGSGGFSWLPNLGNPLNLLTGLTGS